MNKQDIKKNLFTSIVSSGVSEFLTLPVYTIKTNYQNTNSTITNTIKQIYNHGGILSFYRAPFPTIGGQVVSISSKYMFYRYIEELNITKNKILNGSMSGICSTFITHPFDMNRVYNQMNKSFFNEVRMYGPKLFFRGYSKSLIKSITSTSLFFPLHDYYMDYFKQKYKNKQKIEYILLSSFMSAFSSTCIIQPIDYLQTRHIYGKSLYEGFNPLIYYRGLTLNLLRIVPRFMLTMTIMDLLR